MEPDHSATLEALTIHYPEVKIICNAKTAAMMKQFFDFDVDSRAQIVKEGDVFNTGHHELTFIMAPMVHWPEVMVTYDKTAKILFSADAFGAFGALNGAIFADEVNFDRDYMDEARRYYTNIVGKYCVQVQAVLKKASALDIRYICPLHGFVWRSNLGDFIEKYEKWSTYAPEETGVMIAYASVYGNTENAAEIIACRLRDLGVKTVMYDVSVTPASDIVAASFKWSHLVFASTTYNAGIFVTMEALLHDIAAHNLQNRTVAFVENGSWAPTSGKLMREIVYSCKNMTILNETVSLKSSLKPEQSESIDALVSTIYATIPHSDYTSASPTGTVDPSALFKLSYGLFVLSARDGEKDNGCIINTVTQVTDTPKRITIAVNKQNYTHDMIVKTGEFNISVLTESVPFSVFKTFGFQSGKNVDKFSEIDFATRSSNGALYLSKHCNALLSGKVTSVIDCGTHSVFVADVTEAQILSGEPSVTYAYYFAHIKPKPQPSGEVKKGYICKICGYIYEGEPLPADFICPVCKHSAEDFEPLK
ncbi:MAG: flavin reductase, partial [Bacillota bacterium]|nr:flavin reductase [Bacillota bacterium]